MSDDEIVRLPVVRESKIEVTMPIVGSKFLTVTLKPHMYSDVFVKQLMDTRWKLTRLLDRYCFDYCLVAEATEVGNLHYHAWIQMRNINHTPVLCNNIKKLKEFGFISLSKPMDYDTCVKKKEYMEKQNSIVKMLVGKSPYIFVYSPLLIQK